MSFITRRLNRYLFVSLPLFGFLAAAARSKQHFYGSESCMIFGPVPACYIETAGYLMMAIAMLTIWNRHSGKLFYLGWIPVAALAVIGVMMELTGRTACQMGAYAIPICFYALGLAMAVWVLFLIGKRSRP